MIKSVINYLKEVKGEIPKISWPSRKSTKSYTTVVIGTSIFVTIFLGLTDYGLTKFLQTLLR